MRPVFTRAASAVALAALSLMLVQPAQAQWKWRDASGRITASDLPPPRDVADKDILQRPSMPARKGAAMVAADAASGAASAAPAVVARAPAGDKDLEARKKAADKEKEAKAKAEEEKIAANKAENCRRARSYMGTLEGGQRIARTNDKGEREVLDDKGRAEEMRRAREVIASECVN